MKKNNVYILEDRGLLYISGEDCKEFLQNIVTNNIDKVDEKNSCYSALLPVCKSSALVDPGSRK